MKLRTLPYLSNGARYFSAAADYPGAVWLDSGKPSSTEGRYDIISALPSHSLTDQLLEAELVAALNQALHQQQDEPSDLPFTGGWIGFISYEYRHRHFKIPSRKAYACGELWFGWYDWALIQDHSLGKTVLMARDSCTNDRFEALYAKFAAPSEIQGAYRCGQFYAAEQQEHYLAQVHRIQDYIRAGDCYQVNYAQRFAASFAGSEAQAYRVLRQATPNPFCAYLSLPNGSTILSLSQERFVQLRQNAAVTEPIKGTAARGVTPQDDERLRHDLQTSAKNRAENVMIVDLLRNDFSRHCTPFSVKVDALLVLRTYANVHHLVSTISGTLQDGCSHPEFVLECFPGGSITGAPKKRAMEIINQLERFARGPYCGAVGYFSCNQQADFNISIRTLLAERGQIYCWGGGGIVADSLAQEEFAESLHKVQILLSAITNAPTE